DHDYRQAERKLALPLSSEYRLEEQEDKNQININKTDFTNRMNNQLKQSVESIEYTK
ncbi:hypothetical protein SAMN02745782_03327, partial [Vibrio cincinnatiensis DSM 19608]